MSQATLSPRRALLLAALLRVALLAWGAYQDAAPHLPDYSDVDLDVFLAGTRALAACPRSVLLGAPRETYAELAAPLEGAGACAEGYLAALARFLLQLRAHVAARPDEYAASELSEQLLQLSFRVVEVPATLLALAGNPYAAPTFRYSPLLALLLAPALLLPEPLLLRLAPRLLFAAADLLCGVLMLRICRTLRISQAWVAPAWLLNPFVAQISTRGSAESLLGLLVLGWLDATLGATTPDDEQLRLARRQQKVVDANVAHVADAAAEGKDVAAAEADASDALLAADASSSSALSALLSTPLLSPLLLALATHFKLVPAMYALPLALHLAAAAPTGARVGAVLRYGLVCAWATAAIGLVLYGIWGPPYLHSAFLYHFTRLDVRHNFAPHFLPAYLGRVDGAISAAPGTAGALVGFVPQAAVVLLLGALLGKHDLVFACAAQTLAFVTFNKVSTSQYFMWYLFFLPLVAPKLAFASRREPWVLLLLWVGAQALWLSQAYLLEFTALDTYVRTWTASLVLLVVHSLILARCVTAWGEGRARAARLAGAGAKKSQ